MEHEINHKMSRDGKDEGSGKCSDLKRAESRASVKINSEEAPSVYVPFGKRPKHILPITDDDLSEDEPEYETPKKVPQLQSQPRDVEIAYEPRPWRRSLSRTYYYSRNSRGWGSRTSLRGSLGGSRQENEQHLSSHSDDDSIASHQSKHNLGHGGCDVSMERGTSLNKTSNENNLKGGPVDERPSLEKIFAIVDQVHKEKQTRLASLKEDNRPVGNFPVGRTDDKIAHWGSGNRTMDDGSASGSFKRATAGVHSVRIGGTTTFGEDETKTISRNEVSKSHYFIHKKNKGNKNTDNSYLKLRHSLQKESSLKKAKIDVAAIASLQVQKFYTERQQAEQQLEMKLNRSDMLLSGGRSKSVARLKQSSLKSSLSLTDADMKEFIAQSVMKGEPLPEVKSSEMGGTELETNVSIDDEVMEEKEGILSRLSKKYLRLSSRRGDNENSEASKELWNQFAHGNTDAKGRQNDKRVASPGRSTTLGKLFSSAIHQANILLSSLSLVPLSSECYSHPRHKVRHDINTALLMARREFMFHQSRQRQLYTD